MDQTARKEGGSMTKMTDVTEIRDDVSADNGVQSSKLQTMQSLDELNSLKSQLGKTWSELSNIMNKYHAQVIETHEQLEITSLGADSSRILKLERDLKTLRTENGQLLKQIVDNKADIMKLRTENRTMRDEVTMKDTLIEKIQNQMAQEALDYQAELASLKEILEARSRGAELTAPLISSPDTQPAKRRKVSLQQLPARPVLTAPAKRADVIPARTDVTPVRLDVAAPGLDVTPVISNVSAAQADVFSMLASSTPVLDAPSTSSLKNESFRKASASQIPDSEQSATEDTTSQDDGGFVKLDEVGDESNLEELEGLVSEQEEYVQGEASALTDGLESGQEQVLLASLKCYQIEMEDYYTRRHEYADEAYMEYPESLASVDLPMSVNTRKKTLGCIRKFKAFLTEQGEEKEPECVDPEDLNTYIGNFILNAKKDKPSESGSLEYEPESLQGFFCSIDRYLRSKGYAECVMKHEAFQTARDALKSKQQYLKSQGMGQGCKHAEPLSPSEDLQLWSSALGTSSPLSLIWTVWYLNGKLFGVKSVREHYEMLNGDFSVKLHTDRRRYLEFKKRRGSVDTPSVSLKAFELPELPERCPVTIFLEYQRRKPEEMLHLDSSFYLSVTSSAFWRDSAIWYKKAPLGFNKLGHFMQEMCKKAGIAGRRTNVSVDPRQLIRPGKRT